jgi:hypothetical protein
MSSPKIPPPPPPITPPPDPEPTARETKTVAQMKPRKRTRGTAQLARTSRPTIRGASGGTGVYMSS